MGDGLPQNVKIDNILSVDQPVAQTDDLRPGDLRMARPFLLGHSIGCFANDFEQAYESQIEHAVGIQVRAGLAFNQSQSLSSVVEHVTVEKVWITPVGENRG